MDITNFMTWFISQVINMFTWIFNTLDSITFAGTSLLRISVTIFILSCLIPIILTVGKSSSVVASRSERVKSKKGKENNNEESTTH